MATGYKGMAVNGKPNEIDRSCTDCDHLTGYVSWWCENKEAIKYRGTARPSCYKCPYWKPIPTKQELLDKRSKLAKFFGIPISYKYIEVDCSPTKEEK